MKEHELISAVKDTAGTGDQEHTAQAVRATLSVLAERLAGEEPQNLASQLPPALAEVMPSTGKGERFGLDEFYRRVADREGRGCDEMEARRHARATVAALKAAVSPGELEDLASQLPPEFDDLLGTGPVTY